MKVDTHVSLQDRKVQKSNFDLFELSQQISFIPVSQHFDQISDTCMSNNE